MNETIQHSTLGTIIKPVSDSVRLFKDTHKSKKESMALWTSRSMRSSWQFERRAGNLQNKRLSLSPRKWIARQHFRMNLCGRWGSWGYWGCRSQKNMAALVPISFPTVSLSKKSRGAMSRSASRWRRILRLGPALSSSSAARSRRSVICLRWPVVSSCGLLA